MIIIGYNQAGAYNYNCAIYENEAELKTHVLIMTRVKVEREAETYNYKQGQELTTSGVEYSLFVKVDI